VLGLVTILQLWAYSKWCIVYPSSACRPISTF